MTVDGFWTDTHQVTNAQYARFVEATRRVTTAAKPPLAEDYPAGARRDIPPPGPRARH